MDPFNRTLYFRLPLVRGEDVLRVQQRLREEDFVQVGQADGLFGAKTEAGVRAFQARHHLKEDGIVGALTWQALFADAPEPPAPDGQPRHDFLRGLTEPHGYRDSVHWQLGLQGLGINGAPPEGTPGEPETVRRLWRQYGPSIDHWARFYQLPAELILATLCTENQRGDPRATREEPGYVSDARTPHRVSPGLMQVLISTARETLAEPSIDRDWLYDPHNSIRAGSAYMARQRKATRLDPPKVACAYNAGGVYHNSGADNRWRMRQYPIGTGHHADRYVRWFNDCLRMFAADGGAPQVSFYRCLNG